MGKKPRARDFHDRVAARYDTTYDEAYWDLFRAVGWELLKPRLPRQASAKVLDLGCGTGHWGLKLAKSGFHVTFVDESQSMLDVASRKAGSMGLEDRCRFVRADLCDMESTILGQEPGSFALAVAEGNPLSQVRDALKALGGIRKLLANGAPLCATVNNLSHALDHFAREGDMEALEKFVSHGRTQWLAHEKGERFDVTMYSAESLGKLLRKAGWNLDALYGRGVLPLREHAILLGDPAGRSRLLDIECGLARDPSHLGRASQLGFVATPLVNR
ncbi:MAG: class I SAM-dependent methyltransferase [Planctomycetota bacterium]